MIIDLNDIKRDFDEDADFGILIMHDGKIWNKFIGFMIQGLSVRWNYFMHNMKKKIMNCYSI